MGIEIDKNRIKPIEEKVGTKLKVKSSNNTKESKSIFGAIQCLANFLRKRSEKTDRQTQKK